MYATRKGPFHHVSERPFVDCDSCHPHAQLPLGPASEPRAAPAHQKGTANITTSGSLGHTPARAETFFYNAYLLCIRPAPTAAGIGDSEDVDFGSDFTSMYCSLDKSDKIVHIYRKIFLINLDILHIYIDTSHVSVPMCMKICKLSIYVDIITRRKCHGSPFGIAHH